MIKKIQYDGLYWTINGVGNQQLLCETKSIYPPMNDATAIWRHSSISGIFHVNITCILYFSPTSDEEKSGTLALSQSSVVIIIAASAAVVLILFVVIIIVVWYRSKKKFQMNGSEIEMNEKNTHATTNINVNINANPNIDITAGHDPATKLPMKSIMYKQLINFCNENKLNVAVC